MEWTRHLTGKDSPLSKCFFFLFITVIFFHKITMVTHIVFVSDVWPPKVFVRNRSCLSNDSGKVDSNFFVMRQRCFPPIGMFSFLHRECINLHKGRLRSKMHLHSTLILLYGKWLESKDEYMYCFMKFC